MADRVVTVGDDFTLPAVVLGTLGATFEPQLVGGKRAVRKDELVYNVKDYGAVGDGVTDDQPAIQTLINMIRDTASIKGATIHFPSATYAVRAPIDLPTDSTKPKVLRLIGTGRTGSWLKALGTAAGFDAIIRHPAPLPTWSGGQAHEIAFLSFDSNKVAKRNILLTNAHGVHVHDNYGINPAIGPYGNLRIEGNGVNYLSWENVIENNRWEGGSGTDQTQWSDYNLEILSTDNHVNKNIVVRAKVANIVDNGGNNFHFQNHAFYGPRAFWQQGVSGSQWVQCEADAPDNEGFAIEANKTMIVGNRMFWPGGATNPNAVGIYIINPITGAQISNNLISDVPAANKIKTAGRIDVSTTISNNVGAAVDTGNQSATRFSAQYADALTTAQGNARGVGSFDGQFGRSAGTQVVHGDSGFAFGYGNTVGGYGSGAVGSLGTVTGNGSYTFGSRGTDRGTGGKFILSASRFGTDGDQQQALHTMAANTSTTNPTRLTVGASGVGFASVALMSASTSTTGGAIMCDISLAGFCPSTGEAGYWTARAMVKKATNLNASSSLVGSPTFTAGQGDAVALTATPTLGVDTSYGALAISIAAPNASVWHWVARVQSVEVA